MSTRITVTGIPKVVGAMERLKWLCADLTLSFDSVGRQVVQDARSLAPRRSGRLADSVGLDRGRNYASIHAGGSSVPYAGVQNYGWRRRNISATQFLNRAADTKADAAAAEIAQQIDRRIKQAGL